MIVLQIRPQTKNLKKFKNHFAFCMNFFLIHAFKNIKHFFQFKNKKKFFKIKK